MKHLPRRLSIMTLLVLLVGFSALLATLLPWTWIIRWFVVIAAVCAAGLLAIGAVIVLQGLPASLRKGALTSPSRPVVAKSASRGPVQPRAALATTPVEAAPARMSDENYMYVYRALEETSIHHIVVSLNGDQHSQVAVEEANWIAAINALSSSQQAKGAYARVAAARSTTKTWRLGLDPTPVEAFSASLCEIYGVFKDLTSERIYGREFSCHMQRWGVSPDHPDELFPPGANGLANSVSTDEFKRWVWRASRLGSPERRCAAAADPDAYTVDFPIDIVYMWVDSSDPVWEAQMDQYRALSADQSSGESPAGEPGGETTPGAESWRFRTRNELLYSLRSVEMYAPWVRHVYVVTSGQKPRWLELDSDFVSIVTHRDIFTDREVLPVFNSHAIGSQLHHIEGLAEHYLIMNDDMLFQSVVTPEMFFSAGGVAKFRPSKGRRRLVDYSEADELEKARMNSVRLLSQTFPRTFGNFFTHTPVPQLRSAAYELEKMYPDIYATVSASRFRCQEDYELNSWFLLYYLFCTGRAVQTDFEFGYYDLSTVGRDRVERDLMRRDLKVICLNDGPTPPGDDLMWVEPILGRFFARPGSFELPRASWRDDVSVS